MRTAVSGHAHTTSGLLLGFMPLNLRGRLQTGNPYGSYEARKEHAFKPVSEVQKDRSPCFHRGFVYTELVAGLGFEPRTFRL